MARKVNKTIFQQLTDLFRSGPIVKRKIRNVDTLSAVADSSKSNGTLLFQKSLAPSYTTITSNTYNLTERLMRYQDFVEMDAGTPEIAAALNIFADEACGQDENGRTLHIYSDNEKIVEILEDLFYNTLNVEFNLRSWTRNLAKYGDVFLYADVSRDYGVQNVFPIPVNEIEREENFDRDDPSAVRFRWVSLGNRILENWEVIHFRLLGNDMFLPYGSSLIEAARRIWRQLILIEDAMLVYRVVRAPERRVFYIDVGNTSTNDVQHYVEEQIRNMRSQQVVDKDTGRVDLRYSPVSVEEDYVIGVRGSESATKIETLAGGQNTAAIEDVAYIQKKLIAALMIPRAYLGFDEALSSKATLAQLDIRFSRTINMIQKVLISELNKIAIIHLFAHGFDGEDLQNFTLRLTNPSTVAQQQKLELWRTKFELAGSTPEGFVDRNFIRKNLWGLSEKECREIDEGRVRDKIADQKIESAGSEEETSDEDLFGGGEEEGGEEPAEEPEEKPEEELPPPENAGEELPSAKLLTSSDDTTADEIDLDLDFDDSKPPIKISKHLKDSQYNRSRRRTHGASKTHLPDFKKMSSLDDDPYEKSWLSSTYTNPLGESSVRARPPALSSDLKSALKRMSLSEKFVGDKVLMTEVRSDDEDE